MELVHRDIKPENITKSKGGGGRDYFAGVVTSHIDERLVFTFHFFRSD